ncbi:Protein LURP-one-related 3 [Morella rubra]|uniref:Protein LURP-one-related 3 n=1 Tax=Morella rubra TaxID=262757 RepID=A0A6A1UG82_9ROSI|nr:Protein LURP-one-related 3 [Morella rubra]KAB1199341.1 Protein LURP-one-related 3 [Morella rubra]
MKSLVLGGRGCTVFDEKGKIVYRVDNYNSRYRDEVNLMDSNGMVLFTIVRKRSKLFRFWEGYRSTGTEMGKKRPGFQVRKTLRISRGDSPCQVIVGLDENQPRHYKIHGWSSKSVCEIADPFGTLVAELKRKKSACGVDLGNDVLTMVVEPHLDHSLIVGVFVVYYLINCKI